MKKLLEFVRGKFGKKYPYNRCISYARRSSEPSSDELTQIDQLAKLQELLIRLDTGKIMVQEPLGLMKMSADEFDKYFIREVQKLLDIWTKRTRSTSVRLSDKPNLLRLLNKKGGEKSNEKGSE